MGNESSTPSLSPEHPLYDLLHFYGTLLDLQRSTSLHPRLTSLSPHTLSNTHTRTRTSIATDTHKPRPIHPQKRRGKRWVRCVRGKMWALHSEAFEANTRAERERQSVTYPKVSLFCMELDKEGNVWICGAV